MTLDRKKGRSLTSSRICSINWSSIEFVQETKFNEKFRSQKSIEI